MPVKRSYIKPSRTSIRNTVRRIFLFILVLIAIGIGWANLKKDQPQQLSNIAQIVVIWTPTAEMKIETVFPTSTPTKIPTAIATETKIDPTQEKIVIVSTTTSVAKKSWSQINQHTNTQMTRRVGETCYKFPVQGEFWSTVGPVNNCESGDQIVDLTDTLVLPESIAAVAEGRLVGNTTNSLSHAPIAAEIKVDTNRLCTLVSSTSVDKNQVYIYSVLNYTEIINFADYVGTCYNVKKGTDTNQMTLYLVRQIYDKVEIGEPYIIHLDPSMKGSWFGRKPLDNSRR